MGGARARAARLTDRIEAAAWRGPVTARGFVEEAQTLKSKSGWILVFVLLVVVVYTVVKQNNIEARPKQVTITEFTQLVNAKKIMKAEIASDSKSITGFTRNGEPKAVVTDVPDWSSTQNSIFDALKAQGVTTSVSRPAIPDGVVAGLLSFVLPILLIGFMWIFFIRQAQSGGNQAMNFGKSRAKRLGENVPKVTFNDVAGVDEAKQELGEVVEFLRNPKKFQALGAKIPKGVLLLGPPGCGKTLLSRAVAGEAGVPFFHISGSDFVEMFVGVGASRVRDLFETAKANRPALIFIDEIDAVGRQRGAGLGGGHDEREQTLNQLLVEMDGFDPNSGVILIAATNRPDVLDPALLRPGRFDRRVTVDTPDQSGRLQILKVHSKDKPMADDVQLETLAKRTPGFSGADLANLVNEAALFAARKEKTQIEMEDFAEAIERVIAGPQRKSRLLSDKDKETVAYHELGHAIVGYLLPEADPVHKVSILPRGMALGYTLSLPDEDKFLHRKTELLAEITVLLGGGVAEEIVYNEVGTGRQNDLERASDIARRMVMEFGMSDVLGPLSLGRRHGNPFLGRDMMEERNYGEEVATAIDKEVRNIIDQSYAEAKRILTENRALMDTIKDALLEREVLEKEEFETLMQGGVLPPKPIETPPQAPASPAEPERRPQEPARNPRLRPEPA
jgi:cell division protease FtsH